MSDEQSNLKTKIKILHPNQDKQGKSPKKSSDLNNSSKLQGNHSNEKSDKLVEENKKNVEFKRFYSKNIINLTNLKNYSNRMDLSVYFPHYQPIFKILSYYFDRIDSKSDYSEINENLNEEISKKGLKSIKGLKEEIKNLHINGKILLNVEKSSELTIFLKNFAKSNNVNHYSIDFSEIIKNPATGIKNLKYSFKNNIKNMNKPFILTLALDDYSFLIDSIPSINKKDGEIYSKNIFMFQLFKSFENFQPLDMNGIFLVIRNESCTFSEKFIKIFDLNLNFSLPNLDCRKNFISSLTQHIPEQKLDYYQLSLQLNGWNYGEIRRFFKFAQLYQKIINFKSTGKIETLNTSFLLNLIETQKFTYKSTDLPKYGHRIKDLPMKESYQVGKIKNYENKWNLNKNFEIQMYQNAASKVYNDLCLILDKLEKGIVLISYEREILADYAFILRNEPQKSLRKLNKAKMRIDKIMNITEN